jgi:hypothetical protein
MIQYHRTVNIILISVSASYILNTPATRSRISKVRWRLRRENGCRTSPHSTPRVAQNYAHMCISCKVRIRYHSLVPTCIEKKVTWVFTHLKLELQLILIITNNGWNKQQVDPLTLQYNHKLRFDNHVATALCLLRSDYHRYLKITMNNLEFCH